MVGCRGLVGRVMGCGGHIPAGGSREAVRLRVLAKSNKIIKKNIP